MSHHLKLLILLAVALAAIVATVLIAPIAQDPNYHNFADQRRFLGIPHFCNVVSNLPLLLVGLFGMRLLLTRPAAGDAAPLRAGYLIMFLGIMLTGWGSGYYHLSPSNQTLVWDRLPLVVAFMAFFSIIIGENIAVTIGRRMLWPLIFAGVAAVVYWNATEMRGAGDLAPYALAQFLPILLIPLVLILFRSHPYKNTYVWAVFAAYAMAKVAEQMDELLFRWLGIISGHSLKHLFAALCGYLLFLQARSRLQFSLTLAKTKI